jgi:septum formation protein
MTRVVLGSASPGRLAVLRQAGIDPLVVVSGVDEDAVIAALGSNTSAGDVVRVLPGRSGRLYTGHCLLRVLEANISQRASESSFTTVHFAKPAAADLDAYIGSGEPLAVAGGFTLDGLGGWFVDRIEGDPSNVIGLSLPLTRALLQRLGLSVTELWR